MGIARLRACEPTTGITAVRDDYRVSLAALRSALAPPKLRGTDHRPVNDARVTGVTNFSEETTRSPAASAEQQFANFGSCPRKRTTTPL